MGESCKEICTVYGQPYYSLTGWHTEFPLINTCRWTISRSLALLGQTLIMRSATTVQTGLIMLNFKVVLKP
ncbi:hypothetical protein AB205_0206710 [Aquarana catesbeiana]|uniref:Uncharacterized protein n=1 Tax=Aquarana catesbeiana TaxID=8400 RepID=A0A2G9RJZ7_AQUCT|nr:hypothetical protein AB205_0206710 [Aquarana catesbeiana]